MRFLNKIFALNVFFILLILNSCAKDDELKKEDPIVEIPIELPEEEITTLRSEYEKIGDLIFDINDPGEGNGNYAIFSGNEDDYFKIDNNTGVLSVNISIIDKFGEVSEQQLLINGITKNYAVKIVDGYDYYLNNLENGYIVLDTHKEVFVDGKGEWTAYNNLWGKGTATPNEDFRIATIYKEETFPKETILIWDVPSKASEYGGAAVWSYHDIFWGNRKGTREDLEGFPFQIKKLHKLTLDFDFEQLFGNEQYKFAMNMFLTDESELSSFSANDGDFFFVFDQKDTWVPFYPFTLSDLNIGGKPFAWLYKIEDEYEWRRVIIKNNEKLLKGTLGIKEMFDRFIENDFINSEQYIYHIQLGIEVTEGYGAVRINEATMNKN